MNNLATPPSRSESSRSHAAGAAPEAARLEDLIQLTEALESFRENRGLPKTDVEVRRDPEVWSDLIGLWR